MKYEVTLYYCTNVTVEVEANNEENAINAAYQEVEDPKYEKEILDCLEEIADPTVEEVEE